MALVFLQVWVIAVEWRAVGCCSVVLLTYLFECFEIHVRKFDNVERLVAEDFSGVVLEDFVETLG